MTYSKEDLIDMFDQQEQETLVEIQEENWQQNKKREIEGVVYIPKILQELGHAIEKNTKRILH